MHSRTLAQTRSYLEGLNHRQANGDRLDAEIHDAQRAMADALVAAAKQRWEPIEMALQRNTKVQAQLLEIYCLAHAAGDPRLGGANYRASWEGVLADAFPAPSEAEFAAAYAIVKKHLAAEA
jgi:hypothetical protein